VVCRNAPTFVLTTGHSAYAVDEARNVMDQAGSQNMETERLACEIRLIPVSDEINGIDWYD
jgi:hypothetical protein